MTETSTPYSSFWLSKLFECLYLYIAVANFVYMLISTLTDVRYKEDYYLHLFLYSGVGAIIIAIAYSFWWHRNEKKGNANSAIKHAWLRGILRYYLAYEISTYGFAKILRTQFAIRYFSNDIPIGSLWVLNLHGITLLTPTHSQLF